MRQFGWRIPFWIGLLIGILACWMRWRYTHITRPVITHLVITHLDRAADRDTGLLGSAGNARPGRIRTKHNHRGRVGWVGGWVVVVEAGVGTTPERGREIRDRESRKVEGG